MENTSRSNKMIFSLILDQCVIIEMHFLRLKTIENKIVKWLENAISSLICNK